MMGNVVSSEMGSGGIGGDGTNTSAPGVGGAASFASASASAAPAAERALPGPSVGLFHGVAVEGFVVPPRYRLTGKILGHGAYGTVAGAIDTLTGAPVAIKRVGDAFHDLVDAKRILREIKLMRFFGHAHENILSLSDLFVGPDNRAPDFADIYIVTRQMEADLHRVVYSKQRLSDEHVAYFGYQLLRAVKFLHSAGVLHRDIKPSNVLVNANCDLRLCDFGLARGIGGSAFAGVLTQYVVTRWYRAPEIMLASGSSSGGHGAAATSPYGKAVDLWSVGCIIGELVKRKPLFPGADYQDQLSLLCSSLGAPTAEEVASIRSSKAREFMGKHLGRPRLPMSVIVRSKTSAACLDLIDKLLVWDPARRLTVEEALAHPFFAALHAPDDEPAAPACFDFSFERLRLDKPTLQLLVREEMAAQMREMGGGGAAHPGAGAAAFAPASVAVAVAPNGATKNAGGGDGAATIVISTATTA